ncbi:hypothetical protein ACVWV0_002717 [Ewingella americana]
MFIKVRFVDMLWGDVGWLDGEKAQLLKVTGLLVVMIFVSKRPNYAVLKLALSFFERQSLTVLRMLLGYSHFQRFLLFNFFSSPELDCVLGITPLGTTIVGSGKC